MALLGAALAQNGAPNEDTGPPGFPLYGPDNVVVDAVGNLFVTDTDHQTRHRLLKLSPQGRILGEWHLFARGKHKSNGPEGIALDLRGDVYVADQSSNQVLKLSPEGEVLLRIGGEAASDLFDDLGHVAVDRQGRIFVSESKGKVQLFSPEGQRIAMWERGKGTGPEQFSSPESIALSGDGNLFVEDWGNHRVLKLSPEGRTLQVIGAQGKGSGQFMNSSGLAVGGDGKLYVADLALRRIQVFSPAGDLLFSIENDAAGEPFHKGPGGVAVDERGDIYAPDGDTIVKLSPAGKALARWR